MPIYRFRPKKDGEQLFDGVEADESEIIEVVMSSSELDEYKKNNPHLEQVIGLVHFGDPSLFNGAGRKREREFTQVLDGMKKKMPNAKGLQ